MANPKDQVETGADEALSRTGLMRRRLLRHIVWVAPAILGTATVRARAQSGSCNPNCAPAGEPCPPVVD